MIHNRARRDHRVARQDRRVARDGAAARARRALAKRARQVLGRGARAAALRVGSVAVVVVALATATSGGHHWALRSVVKSLAEALAALAALTGAAP